MRSEKAGQKNAGCGAEHSGHADWASGRGDPLDCRSVK